MWALVGRYWREGLIVAVCVYVWNVHNQRDAARADLAELQTEVRDEVVRATERERVLKEDANRRALINEAIWKGEIDESQKRVAALLGERASLVSVNDGLRNAADSTREALSSALEYSRSLAGAGQDCHDGIDEANKYIAVLTEAAIQTDRDYRTLWMAAHEARCY